MELLNQRIRRIACVALVAAAGTAAAPGRGDVRAQSAAVGQLSVPGRTNAYVSLAASGASVVAVWAASDDKGGTDIYAAVSRNSGRTFAAPTRVNSTPGTARVNGEQPPRVTIAGGTTAQPHIVVIWTALGSSGTRLLTARSRDGGSSFEPETLVPGRDTAGNRGWEGLAAAGDRTLAVWLDHWQLADRSGQKPHQHGQATSTAQASADGVAMAQLSQLYFAPLGGSQAPRAITGGVCYCCKTAIATRGADAIYLAWRHVYPGNLRDIAFTASADGGRTFAAPIRVSEDQWAINGCPDDGPAMAVDGQGRVHVVWPTVVVERGGTTKGPTKALFHAVSIDGRRFGPRTRIPAAGAANHPQLAIASDGSLLVAWDEVVDGARRVAAARGVVRTGRQAVFEARPPAGAGSYPVAAATPSGVVLAWTGEAPEYGVFVAAP